MLKKTVLFIILAVLMSSLVYLSYILVKELTFQPVQITKSYEQENQQKIQETAPIKVPEIELSYSSSPQFYPNMRFPKTSLSYYLEQECSDEKIERIKQAMFILENRTKILKFEEAIENADIYISCTEKQEEISREYYTAGEGGAKSIIDAGFFYIIETGEILLFYRNSECKEPNIEIHELLHVFGFQHSNNPKSIMYNISSCEQILTDDIINELTRLYSIKQAPDLAIKNISSTKHSIYLDFIIEIKNQGLNLSETSELEVYEKNKLIQKFFLGKIRYGEGKIFTVQNLYVGFGARNFRFIAKTEGEQNSYSEIDVNFE